MDYVRAGHVLLIEENEEPAGYLLGLPGMRSARYVRPITQAAVALDLQRSHCGLSLVEAVCGLARDNRSNVVQAWCREELAANLFGPPADLSLSRDVDPRPLDSGH